MAASVKEIIHRRKSVRTFSGETLRSDDRQKLDKFLKTLDNPFYNPAFATDDSIEYIITYEVKH